MCRHYASLLQDYSAPIEGSKQLKFDDKYPKPMMTQFWAIFAKYMAAYWRMPEYNGTRILLALAVGFLFGAMFWRLGDKVYVLHPSHLPNLCINAVHTQWQPQNNGSCCLKLKDRGHALQHPWRVRNQSQLHGSGLFSACVIQC